MKQLLCIGIVASVAVAALIMLVYFLGSPSTTGAVTTGICPQGSTPIYAEGEGVYLKEIARFQRLGHKCFFGYDGITVCCFGTAE